MDIAALVMKAFFLDFVLPLAAVMGCITAFHYIEINLVSRKVSERFSELISGRRTPRGDVKTFGDIVTRSLGFFDIIFGNYHWTRRCFLISTLFTLFFSILTFLAVGLFAWVEVQKLLDVLLSEGNLQYLAVAIILNIFVDYLSLWETRLVISFIRSNSRFPIIILFIFFDALFTFAIFIIAISLFRSILDYSFLIFPLNELENLSINSVLGSSISLTKADGIFVQFWAIVVFNIKLSLLSAIDVIFELPDRYWVLTLVVDGKIKYAFPASTMWATTHLSSIYIYLYIILTVFVTRLVFLHKINITIPFVAPRHAMIIKKGIDSEAAPLTLLAANLLFYLFVIYVFASLWLHISNPLPLFSA